MCSFLGLMQSISYTKKIGSSIVKKELVMTQYRFKLIMILANLLITHLLDINAVKTSAFVKILIKYLNDQTIESSQSHREIRKAIPVP